MKEVVWLHPLEIQISNFDFAGTTPNGALSASPNPVSDPVLEVVPLAGSAPIFSDFSLQAGDTAAQLANCGLPPGVGAPKKYGVDLAGPRLALAAGPLIDLLIQCGAHNYLEFKVGFLTTFQPERE